MAARRSRSRREAAYYSCHTAPPVHFIDVRSQDPSVVGTMKGRKTGGRKKGTRNKRSVAQIEAAAAIVGGTPLEFMLGVMRDVVQPTELRLSAATAAAQYCHAKLKSIEHSGPGGGALEYEINMNFNEGNHVRNVVVLECPTGPDTSRHLSAQENTDYLLKRIPTQ
jgi:hypothetical protein